jgi:molybdopterin synthase sulfur carrier subunit
MTLEVRFFASLVDRTGCAVESVELDEAANVGGLWDELVRRHPALAGIGFRPLVACDCAYATWDRPLEGVREVAFLPPVSGG